MDGDDRVATVDAILDASEPVVAAAAVPRAKGTPGRKPTSNNPTAVRAREKRAREKAVKSAGIRGEVFTPDKMAGPLSSPVSPEDIRALAADSLANILQGAGVALSLFLGDHWQVEEREAKGTAVLMLDAWPELAAQAGDTTKFLAVVALTGMIGSRVKTSYEKRQRKPVVVVERPRTVAPEHGEPETIAPVPDLGSRHSDPVRPSGLGWSTDA